MGEHKQPTALERTLWEVRRGLAAVAAISLFLNLLVLVSPLYMFQVFDRVLPSGHVETLVALTVAAGFALLVFGVLEVIRHQALVRMSTWLDRRLSEPVLAASVGEALAERTVGAQPLRDVAQLRAFLSSESVFPVLDAPWTLVFIAVIWMLHPWLGVLALLAAGLLFALALASEIVMRAPLREANERWMAAQQSGETALRNAEVVHAMGVCCRRSCDAGMPIMIAPSSGTRRQATVAPSWSAAPSSCACSSRSPSSDSAPTWCWMAS